jgi:outer membrane protein insertion porin family
VHQRGKPATRIDLGKAAPVEKAVRQWRALLADAMPDRQAGLALKRLVWLPLENHLEGAKVILLSPDGALIAYASDRAGEGSLDIWVQAMTGGDPIRITRGADDEDEPSFSPDGSQVELSGPAVFDKFSDKKLLKEIGVKKHDPLNAYAAEESRRKIEELYHTGGYPKATVSIFEGDKPGDKDLVFLINEGQLERIGSVSFEGNAIASDGVLKTKVQSKPGYFWYLFGGKVDRSKIEADVQTLTAYYRALGYFRARVSRTLDYDEANKWLTLKFIIDEGPRYKVRNVSVEGGTKFATDPLLKFLELKSGEYFNQGESNKDVTTLIDLYGSQGHVFADIQPDLRFLEEPGTLDVAYRIKEGDVFKVSEINVHIAGEFPHTKQTVVLSRVSLRPGDVIDTREVRNSERRLKASQLFAGTQNDGEPPRIVVRPPDLNSLDTIRGQEPEAARAAPPGQPHALQNSATPPPQNVLQPSSIYSWEGRQPNPAVGYTPPTPQPSFAAQNTATPGAPMSPMYPR